MLPIDRGELTFEGKSVPEMTHDQQTLMPQRASLLFQQGGLSDSTTVEEKDHAALQGAESLGTAVVPRARLVDLGAYPALIEVSAPGAPQDWSVVGELYVVDDGILTRLDVLKQHPALFQRRALALADGRVAQVYVMRDEQLRGRKRLPSGDWKKRFEPRRRADFTEPRAWHRKQSRNQPSPLIG